MDNVENNGLTEMRVKNVSARILAWKSFEGDCTTADGFPGQCYGWQTKQFIDISLR
jgi:hypothetical protein